MVYKHKIVQGLAQLITKYAGEGKDPFMRGLWWGFKGQIPSILQGLDNNGEAIVEMHRSIMEALDIEPPDGFRWDIGEMSIQLVPEEEIAIGETRAPEEEETEETSKKERGEVKEPELGE